MTSNVTRTPSDTTHAAAPESGREAVDPRVDAACRAFVGPVWEARGFQHAGDYRRRMREAIAAMDALSQPAPAAAGAGFREALAGKIAEARRYADREGFEASTVCPSREETALLLAALAASPAGAGPVGGEIAATQITLGEGAVDITEIQHDGKKGVLFRPRKEHIPFGEPGQLPEGTYWPVQGDVVLWVSGQGPRVAIDALAALTAPPAAAETVGEVLTEEQKADLISLRNHLESEGHLGDADAITAALKALATHRQSAQAGAGDGFVLVPREPTEAMCWAAIDTDMPTSPAHWVVLVRGYARIYRAMIAAAPIGTGNGEASV